MHIYNTTSFGNVSILGLVTQTLSAMFTLQYYVYPAKLMILYTIANLNYARMSSHFIPVSYTHLTLPTNREV